MHSPQEEKSQILQPRGMEVGERERKKPGANFLLPLLSSSSGEKYSRRGMLVGRSENHSADAGRNLAACRSTVRSGAGMPGSLFAFGWSILLAFRPLEEDFFPSWLLRSFGSVRFFSPFRTTMPQMNSRCSQRYNGWVAC